jgi:hypothetical protein
VVNLGDRVRDFMTGFDGIAVSRTEYMYGCVSIGVQATVLPASGEPTPLVYFDEQRMVGFGPDEVEAQTGGPGEVPPPRSTPPTR